jgi:hypothetical protein
VGTQGGKKSLQARFFAAASPAASALAGFPPKRLTQPSGKVRVITLRNELGGKIKEFYKSLDSKIYLLNLQKFL